MDCPASGMETLSIPLKLQQVALHRNAKWCAWSFYVDLLRRNGVADAASREGSRQQGNLR